VSFLDKVSDVLFLGAGASRPLGKMLMYEFIAHLGNIPGVRDHPLFGDIVSAKSDLEYLLEQLGNIQDIHFLRYRLQGGTATPIFARQATDLARKEESFEDLAKSAAKLMTAIQREVFIHYRAIEEGNERSVVKLLEPLIKDIHERSAVPPVIFTTNYDPAVEKFCQLSMAYECIDGFANNSAARSYEWHLENYENPSMDRERAIYLFKLHGSADWIKDFGRIVKGSTIYVEGDKDHTNMMIYPATRKIAYEEPYFSCYNYLEECLARAKRLLVIGYSFRDYDAVTRMRSALRRNPDLKIEVVSPDAQSLVQRLWKEFGIPAMPRTGSLNIDSPLPEIGPKYKD
jgi:hypothetical protein